MAYSVSDKYKQVIYSQSEKNKIKISFNGVNLPNAGEYCEKFSIKSSLFADDGNKVFKLNDFVAREGELILHKIALSTITSPITIQIGTLVGNNPLVETDYEWIPMGIFNIQDNPTTDKDKITITLRDNAVKFDFKYNAEPLIKLHGGKATKKQIFQDICSQAGVQTTVTSFLGENDEVGTSDNTINARLYIAMLAEQAGCIATIDRTGKLIFVNLSSLYTWRIPLSVIEKYEIGEPFEIKRVVYENLIKYETSPDETLDTLYLDSTNLYINSKAQVDSIFNKIKNFKIDSVKTGKVLGNPAIDCYDLIQIYDDYHNNKILFTTLGSNDYAFTGVHRNTFQTEISLEQRKENVTLRGDATFKRWARAEIDNVNSQVIIEAGRIDDIATPTKIVNGSSIYIEDATETTLINTEIEGNVYQKTTTGKNLLNVESDLTFTRSKTIQVNLPAGSYHVTNSSVTTSDGSEYVTIRFANNGAYILSNSRDRIVTLNSNETTVYLYAKTDYPTSYGITATITDLMISVNGGEYEPYTEKIPSPNPDYKQKIETLNGYNLVNIKNFEPIGAGRINYSTDNDTLKITTTTNGTFRCGSILVNNLKVGKNYNLCVNLVSDSSINKLAIASVVRTNGSGYKEMYLRNEDDINFTAEETSAIVRIGYTLNVEQNAEVILNKIQLIEGTKKKIYLPYGHIGLKITGYETSQERMQDIDLNGNELTTGDKIIIDRNGNTQLIKKWEKIVLNGSEDWLYLSSANPKVYYISMPNCKKNFDFICNSYIKTSKGIAILNNFEATSTGGLGVYLWVRDDRYTTTTEFKQWLSNNNVIVYYELETPEIIELPKVNLEKLFKGINHIDLLANLETNFTIEYVRDNTINSYIEGQILGERTIRNEDVSRLTIKDNEILEEVYNKTGDLNDLYKGIENRISANEATLKLQEKSFDSDGNVKQVIVKQGMTFDENGLLLYSELDDYSSQFTTTGTIYKDGESIVGQYTKDGSKQKDLELFGLYKYGKKNIEDNAMFVGQLYTAKFDDGRTEEGFGHFYNGGNV